MIAFSFALVAVTFFALGLVVGRSTDWRKEARAQLDEWDKAQDKRRASLVSGFEREEERVP